MLGELRPGPFVVEDLAHKNVELVVLLGALDVADVVEVELGGAGSRVVAEASVLVLARDFLEFTRGRGLIWRRSNLRRLAAFARACAS